MSHVIDVIDHKGDKWELMAPPMDHDTRSHELWLGVRRTTATGGIRNYPCIPVPCFTDWFMGDTP